MMSTITVFGWGIVLTEQEQGKLEEAFLNNIKLLPPNHFFRESPWFPDSEYFFLFDALEHFYEKTLHIASATENKIIITAKSLTTTIYDNELLTQERLLTVPTIEESAHIYNIIQQVGYKEEPSWVLHTHTY